MKVRSQLLISVVIAVAVGLGAGCAVWWAAADVERADADQEQAQSLAREVASLLVLTHEFAADGESRPARQWPERYSVVARTLKTPAALSAVPKDLVVSANRLPDLFSRLAQLVTQTPDDFVQRRKQFLIDQLVTDIQVLLDGAHRWTRDAGMVKEKAQRQLLRMGFAASGLFLLLLLGQAWLVMRRVLRPIAALEQATRAIEAGEWSVRLNSGARNELGDLARHFDN